MKKSKKILTWALILSMAISSQATALAVETTTSFAGETESVEMADTYAQTEAETVIQESPEETVAEETVETAEETVETTEETMEIIEETTETVEETEETTKETVEETIETVEETTEEESKEEIEADAANSFRIEGTVLREYTGTGGAVTIPSYVTEIGYGAFDGETGITSVYIPASVKKNRGLCIFGLYGTGYSYFEFRTG